MKAREGSSSIPKVPLHEYCAECFLLLFLYFYSYSAELWGNGWKEIESVIKKGDGSGGQTVGVGYFSLYPIAERRQGSFSWVKFG